MDDVRRLRGVEADVGTRPLPHPRGAGDFVMGLEWLRRRQSQFVEIEPEHVLLDGDNVEIDDEDYTPENFGSIRALARLIDGLQRERRGAVAA